MAKAKVKKIQLFLDPIGNTMNIWWDDPRQASYSEEAEEGLDVIVFDRNHRPIGFEKIGVFPKEIDPLKRFLPPLTSLLVAK